MEKRSQREEEKDRVQRRVDMGMELEESAGRFLVLATAEAAAYIANVRSANALVNGCCC